MVRCDRPRKGKWESRRAEPERSRQGLSDIRLAPVTMWEGATGPQARYVTNGPRTNRGSRSPSTLFYSRPSRSAARGNLTSFPARIGLRQSGGGELSAHCGRLAKKEPARRWGQSRATRPPERKIERRTRNETMGRGRVGVRPESTVFRIRY
jgi:hypothetical protein